MRTYTNLLALVGALLLGGCLHPPTTPPPPIATDVTSATPAMAPRLLHVYVDCALPAESPERNRALAETVALTLRDQLRQRGYDVRGAESIIRDETAATATGDAITQLGLLARTIAAGNPPPAATRYAAYLHTNAPRLVLFAALEPADTIDPLHAKGLRLGGLLADSATGEVRWSDQIATRTTGDDQNVRRLAVMLLSSLNHRSPK